MINAKRTPIERILKSQLSDKEKESVEVWGWIRTSRFSKNISFISINDGSSFESLQLVVENNNVKVEENKLLTGSSVRARGRVVASSGGSQAFEVQVKELDVISAADEQFPLQKKRHTQEFLREIAHLRPRTNTHLAVGIVRSKLAMAIHKFFTDSGFRYIHAPILTKSDCEGAGETFRVTSQDPAKSSASAPFSWKNDLFSQEVYLTVSGQLEAEALAMGLGKVYTFGPTFRADPSETTRHASEFWMVEPEAAFYDLDDLKVLTSQFIKSITNYVWKECQDEIKFFTQYIEPELPNRFKTILEEDFGDITYHEAQALLAKSNKNFEIKPAMGNDIATEHERYLVDEVFKKPLFVTNYPKTIKPFYMKQNDNQTVACFDLLAPGIGEIIGGSQREERYDVLEREMKAHGMGADYAWYLETRQWGSVPHAGFGLGFERMMMYLTGIKNIKDVIAFPRASRRVW